jgi:Lon protease-like protein
MFPLGTVLLPGAPLPLHVFEPRYRQLTADCLAGEPEFGVVLIERGSEVGGGDVRTGVGTLARIVAAQSLPDGRAFLMTVGTRRIRVVEWLEDAPYPRAMVEPLEDETTAGAGTPDATVAYAQLVATTRRALAMAAELGVDAGDATREFPDDPSAGTFDVAAVAPLGMLDRQRVLATTSAGERCALLLRLLDEATELLRFRLTGGSEPGSATGAPPGHPAGEMPGEAPPGTGRPLDHPAGDAGGDSRGDPGPPDDPGQAPGADG